MTETIEDIARTIVANETMKTIPAVRGGSIADYMGRLYRLADPTLTPETYQLLDVYSGRSG